MKSQTKDRGLLVLVDAALQGVSVGIASLDSKGKGDSRLIYQSSEVVVHDSARRLPELVEAGLSSLGVDFSNVVGLVVNKGPGSFTGLRVSLSYLLGLNTGFTRKWLGLDGLAVIFGFLKESNKDIGGVCLPQTKTTGFLFDGSSTRAIDLSKLDELQIDGKKIYIIGEWHDLVKALPHLNFEIIEMTLAARLLIEKMADIAVESWPQAFSDGAPLPNYMRRSTVEEQDDAKQRKQPS